MIDGSKRSSHSNAFVSGFSRWRKVVIFDTLLSTQEQSEILAVVNHELGHVAHHHIVWNMASALIQIVLMFTVFSWCLEDTSMLRSFGFFKECESAQIGKKTECSSKYLALFVFTLVYSPTSFVTRFF